MEHEAKAKARQFINPEQMKVAERKKIKIYDKPRQHIKKQRHYFANEGPSSQGYGFSSSHVRMWELAHKECWAPMIWCFRTVVLEKTLESPLDYKEIQPVNSKGNQSWIFTEGLMLELKLQYFGHLMQRADWLEKTLILGKIQGKRRMGQQRMKWLDGITDSMDVSLRKFRAMVKDRDAWMLQFIGSHALKTYPKNKNSQCKI